MLKEVVAVSFKMKVSLLEKNSKDFLLICKTNQLKKKIQLINSITIRLAIILKEQIITGEIKTHHTETVKQMTIYCRMRCRMILFTYKICMKRSLGILKWIDCKKGKQKLKIQKNKVRVMQTKALEPPRLLVVIINNQTR